MRISDWSSDVCSSDLASGRRADPIGPCCLTRLVTPHPKPEPTAAATKASMTSPLKVHLIAAARPNFMKVAPLYHALRRTAWCAPLVVHTGQHYDHNMSGAFLAELGLPDPDHPLGKPEQRPVGKECVSPLPSGGAAY